MSTIFLFPPLFCILANMPNYGGNYSNMGSQQPPGMMEQPGGNMMSQPGFNQSYPGGQPPPSQAMGGMGGMPAQQPGYSMQQPPQRQAQYPPTTRYAPPTQQHPLLAAGCTIPRRGVRGMVIRATEERGVCMGWLDIHYSCLEDITSFIWFFVTRFISL